MLLPTGLPAPAGRPARGPLLGVRAAQPRGPRDLGAGPAVFRVVAIGADGAVQDTGRISRATGSSSPRARLVPGAAGVGVRVRPGRGRLVRPGRREVALIEPYDYCPSPTPRWRRRSSAARRMGWTFRSCPPTRAARRELRVLIEMVESGTGRGRPRAVHGLGPAQGRARADLPTRALLESVSAQLESRRGEVEERGGGGGGGGRVGSGGVGGGGRREFRGRPAWGGLVFAVERGVGKEGGCGVPGLLRQPMKSSSSRPTPRRRSRASRSGSSRAAPTRGSPASCSCVRSRSATRRTKGLSSASCRSRPCSFRSGMVLE